MTTAREHFASVYSWMVDGTDAAIARGQQELADIGLSSGGARYAVDLGAGFGMHSIPLARAGCRVLAVDSSARLLQELRTHAPGMAITTALDDLLNFPRHLLRRAMGVTTPPTLLDAWRVTKH